MLNQLQVAPTETMNVHVSSETYIRLERLFFYVDTPGGGHIGSPHVFEINTKIAPRGGMLPPPFILKCMTKEEIIARKNVLRATGHNVPVVGS